MNLLAIDTSTDMASVALLANGSMSYEEQGSQKTHAQILLPMIESLMVKAGVSLSQLDGIVFGCGPGSFTGLRIACSVAKGLAYAHDLDLIPVSSLATIAWRARKEVNDSNAPVLAVLDARMNELYWSFLDAQQYCAQEQVSKAQLIDIPLNNSVVLAGVGISLYGDALSDTIKTKISHRFTLFPIASAMIELVCDKNIKPIPVALAEPVYVRNQVTQGGTHG